MRPPKTPPAVVRYEVEPGVEAQADFGVFPYTVIAFALMVWTLGAAVNLSTISFSANTGDVVSASDFNAAFNTANSNFTALQDAVNTNRSGGAQTLEAACAGVTSTFSTFGQVDITPPADGYVLVQASGYVDFLKPSTAIDPYMKYGLSTDGTSFATSQEHNARLDGDLPAGYYHLSLAAHQMFPVTGNTTNLFFFAGREVNPDGDPLICDLTLTAMFVPEQFGTISTSSIAPTTLEPR